MYLSNSMQSILHSKHRAGVSQGRNTDQMLPHFPQMSSVLAASGGGQRGRDRESPVIPRGIPAEQACGVSARLLSESHQELFVFFQLGTTDIPTRCCPSTASMFPQHCRPTRQWQSIGGLSPSPPHIKGLRLYIMEESCTFISCLFLSTSRPSTLLPPNSSAKTLRALILHPFSKSHDSQQFLSPSYSFFHSDQQCLFSGFPTVLSTAPKPGQRVGGDRRGSPSPAYLITQLMRWSQAASV